MMSKSLWSIAFLVLAFSACATAPAGAPRLDPGEASALTARAEVLAAKLDYASLKEAFGIYRTLYDSGAARTAAAPAYFKTALLLSVRAKEVGIDTPLYFDTAQRVLEETPGLAGSRSYLICAGRIPRRSRGVVRDIQIGLDLPADAAAMLEQYKAARVELEARAGEDELAAYILTGLLCGYRFAPDWFDPGPVMARFPDSLLLKYRRATCGEADAALLEEILAAAPDFHEAGFHLAEASILAGRALTAEKLLLRAREAIPESPQITILLGSLAFATEEFERSIGFYDETLALAPEYRDALLGKAVSLSYLGRHEEAIAIADRMIDLGYWLLGEAYYWLAWNKHAQGRLQEALADVDQSKPRLGTNSEVFGLAGTIALELGEFGRAEADFREALVHDDDHADSLTGLGRIDAARGRWPEAAGWFARGGGALDAHAAGLEARIGEIEAADLPAERKAAMRRRKETQLERTRLAAASAAYNAAAAYKNAGESAKAAEWAEKAAAHPVLKDRAAELLRQLGR